MKEKILLHLLAYAQYSDYDEVPEAVTQQGIANVIYAPRPHVSIALKDLRNNAQLLERQCHIERGKRRQKVYFLTSSGLQHANTIKLRIIETEILVRSENAKHHQKIGEACSENDLSLFDILARLTDEGVLDLTQPIVRPPGQSQENLGIEPKSTIQKQTQIQTQTTPTTYPTVQHKQQKPLATRGYPQPLQYPQYRSHDNYSRYYQYYYDQQPVYTLSEKAYATMFFIGYLLILLGTGSGIVLLGSGELLLIIPLILFLAFGFSVMGLAAGALWMNGAWQKRILILLSITVPVLSYLVFFAAVEPNINYYDLILWIIILSSFLGLANFATFIHLHNRAAALGALGIILIIDAPVILMFGTLTILQTGFWLLFGVLCLFLGYHLLVKLEDEYEHSVAQQNYLAQGILSGLGFGIMLPCLYSFFVFDFSTLSGFDNIIYGIIGLWCLVGILMVYLVLAKNGEYAYKTVKGLQVGMPLFFGVILLFFGVFLIGFEKIFETVIEFFLGLTLIVYGVKRLKGQPGHNIFLTGLTACAVGFTLLFLIY